MNVNDLAQRLGDACYVFLAINFFWGLYCVIMGWRKVGQLAIRRRDQQTEFLNEVVERIQAGNFHEVEELCADDPRALPQLTGVAVANRAMSFDAVKQSVAEVLHRDILGEMEFRTAWIANVIKSGPLLGLFGTVLGMMAAFGRIGEGKDIDAVHIADEISIALICTAMGLATAIPFNYMLAGINVRMRRMQDSVAAGMARVLAAIKTAKRENLA